MSKMKGKIIIAVAVLTLLVTACATQRQLLTDKDIAGNLKRVKKELHNPDGKKVLVAAHRGDWRNAPENSVQGLKNCIVMGVDIVEFDLAITKDGQLIVMHDKTIDRTTNGTGKPETYTLDELKKLKLRNGAGHVTAHTIPTLEEMLVAAKDKVMLCVDKGFAWFDKAMEMIRRYGMEEQVIYNIPAAPLDSISTLQLTQFDDKLLVNLLGFPEDTTQAAAIIKSYALRKNAIMHPVFASGKIAFVPWMAGIKKNGLGLWLNSLWPEHNGGHDDDRAVEKNEPDKAWGWLADHGATIIQTDRPALLLQYLRKQKLHW
jgi:glycerophosphoryl diester phosphodiesterase